jgi:hypothetical protein
MSSVLISSSAQAVIGRRGGAHVYLFIVVILSGLVFLAVVVELAFAIPADQAQLAFTIKQTPIASLAMIDVDMIAARAASIGLADHEALVSKVDVALATARVGWLWLYRVRTHVSTPAVARISCIVLSGARGHGKFVPSKPDHVFLFIGSLWGFHPRPARSALTTSHGPSSRLASAPWRLVNSGL